MKWLPGTGPLSIGALMVSLGIVAFAFFLQGEGGGTPKSLQVAGGGRVTAYPTDANLIQIASTTGAFADWQKILGESGGGTTASEQLLSTTEQVGRQIFSGYLGLTQQGLFDDAESQSQLLSQIVATTESSGEGKHYTASDLHLVAETPETLQSYLANIRAALNTTFEVKENEIITFGRAAQDNNEDELKQLDVPIAIYSNIVKKLLSMPTPKSAEAAQLSLANNFSDLAAVLKTMEGLYSDPLGALASFKKIPDVQKSLQQSITDMSAYFTARKSSL